jgi:segregation and condensation protein B
MSQDAPRRKPAPDWDLAGLKEQASDPARSRDDLGEAFAQALSRCPGSEAGERRSPLAERAAPLATSAPKATGPQPPEAEDASGAVTPRSIVEAVLFVGNSDNQPVRLEQLTSLLAIDAQAVEELIRQLNAQYAWVGRPYCIVSEGAGFRMVLRHEYESLRDRCYARTREARLSKSAIEVLSIVAYNQPIGIVQIDELRGKPSAGLLRQLVRRQLVAVQRATDGDRLTSYCTTERFLRLFGLDSLDDLPNAENLDHA